jgi:hypothetical protein
MRTSNSFAQSAKPESEAPTTVPPSAVSQSAMDLRTAPRQIHETADSIFVVRDDCTAPLGFRIEQYSKSTLTSQSFTVTHCERFAGNVISAIAADAKNLYIEFGVDEDEGTSPSKEGAPNLLVLNRATYREVATSHTAFWIDRLDASGSDLVGCNCIGTFQLMPTHTCVIAKKFPSKVRFSETDLPAGVACLGGSAAVAAARIFTAGNVVSDGVAVNEKYIVEPSSNAPTAVYTVATPTQKLDMTLPPPGYEVAALGTGPTAASAVLIRKNGRTTTVAIEHIPDGKVTNLMELPAPNDWPNVHLYARWLVAANADTIFIKEMAPPNGSFLFKTADNSWIRAADVYGHLLYVRPVPFGADTSRELPALQIDLDLLRQ